jgi:hypothetical protein
MLRRLGALGALAATCLLAGPVAVPARAARAQSPPTFGRMFPRLPAFTDPTVDQLAALAQTMLEQPGPDGDNRDIPSGFTYFGQFIDHDITRDELPTPTATVDPTTIPNKRTPELDLDSLYGAGPEGSPELYYGAKLRLALTQGTNDFPVYDVPRRADGSAIIGDNRNDENLIVLQLHVAFARFHNRLVDQGLSFKEAQRLTRLHYQYLVLNDYLPKVVGADRVRRLGLTNPRKMPVEFSVAAFRFGHSEVRDAYELSSLTNDNPVPVFSFADPARTLAGGRPIPTGFGVDWAYFFNVEGAFDELGNLSRLFDPKISLPLFQLPIPGAEAEGSNVLAFRTMNRGLFYGLPSGQAVAKALRVKAIAPATLNLGPGFENGTPLWYYVLAEAAQSSGGARLGPVGGSIVADVLLTALAKTPGSVLQRPFQPTVAHTGAFTMGDLLLFAGSFTKEQLQEHLDEQAEDGGEPGGQPGGDPTPAPDPAGDQAPSRPTGVTVKRLTRTTARVTWLPATDDVGVTAYQVEHGRSLLRRTASTTAVVLVAPTRYEVRVRAFDSAGHASPAARVVVPAWTR